MQLVYERAADVLDRLQRREGSLKVIVFSKKNSSDSLSFRKRVYAVAAETIKCKAVLLKVIESSDLLKKEPQLTRNLALVLLHDFLYGKGIQCGGPLKYCVLRHKDYLKRCLKAIRQEKDRQSCTFQIPRYIRVNQLKTSVASVITLLEKDGFVLCDHGCEKLHTHFSIDPILQDVFVFHSSVNMTDHPLYHDSRIILQDKASCLPAFLLAPPPGSSVMDCCAAPGNKTIQLASIMMNKGLIKAFDRDPERFAILKERLREAGATCVTPVLTDILQINCDEFSDTEYVLVDPSCSGSGIINRLSYHQDQKNTKRLAKLASFQFNVLKLALSFPAVKKVVYSTCSVHEEENELVVCKALQESESRFELEYILPEWSCRGLPLFSGGERCLRAGPHNGTNGFFIAMFVRKSMLVVTPRSRRESNRQGVEQRRVQRNFHKGRKRKRTLPVTISKS